jgi:predicted DNA-binding transcriptional regulator YafY
MDVLRSKRRPVTASTLSEQLSVSVRTIYRDVQALIELGASIDGGAGIGYVLRAGFFMPPLMFTEDELESLVLGARWVQGQGDEALTRSAQTALAKISAAAPRDLRDQIEATGLWAPRWKPPADSPTSLTLIREAIRYERKLTLHYKNAQAVATERVVWPVALAFFEGTRILAGWCELREDFRHFRTDRIARLEQMPTRMPRPRLELVKLWKQQLKPRSAEDAAPRS